MPNVESSKFPTTIKLNEGDEVVVIPLMRRSFIKEGEPQVVYNVVQRGKPDNEQYSLFWPRGLSEPKLNEPLLLRRVAKYDYLKITGASPEEMKTLWTTGTLAGIVPNAPPAAGSSPSDVLARFK